MSTRPTAPELARMLGRAHASYEALTMRAGATCEWKKYTKDSPWVLRVSEGTRTLFYVKPDRGSFEVTVLLGPRATKAALGGRLAKALHPSLRSARAYAEGRPVRVVVRTKRDLEGVNQRLTSSCTRSEAFVGCRNSGTRQAPAPYRAAFKAFPGTPARTAVRA